MAEMACGLEPSTVFGVSPVSVHSEAGGRRIAVYELRLTSDCGDYVRVSGIERESQSVHVRFAFVRARGYASRRRLATAFALPSAAVFALTAMLAIGVRRRRIVRFSDAGNAHESKSAAAPQVTRDTSDRDGPNRAGDLP